VVALHPVHKTFIAKKPIPAGFPVMLDTISDHIRAVRMTRRLFQKDVAEIIGVTTSSIENWEIKRSKPNLSFYPKIFEFLGYCVIQYVPDGAYKQSLWNYRFQLGISIEELARKIRIDGRAIANIKLGGRISSQTEKKMKAFLKAEFSRCDLHQNSYKQ
jgi:DNA-binding XRE family transcriptional regulator